MNWGEQIKDENVWFSLTQLLQTHLSHGVIEEIVFTIASLIIYPKLSQKLVRNLLIHFTLIYGSFF